MAGQLRFAEGLSVVPVLGPIAFTTAAMDTEYIDMRDNHWCTFLVMFGSVTSDTSDTVTITIQCSSVSTSATGDDIAFTYRLSSVIETDSWGAITAATSDGLTLTSSTDLTVSMSNRALLVSVNADDLPAKKADGRYISMVLTPTAEVAAGVVSVCAVLENRYPGNSIPSSS